MHWERRGAGMPVGTLWLYLTWHHPDRRSMSAPSVTRTKGRTMADRNLRGMRLGAISLQSEDGVEFASRRKSTYRTDDGETFEVVFSADAEIPEVWESPKSGREGRLIDEDGNDMVTEVAEVKPARTHWDMLLERRTRAELEVILQERLDYLRARRGQIDLDDSRKSA